MIAAIVILYFIVIFLFMFVVIGWLIIIRPCLFSMNKIAEWYLGVKDKINGGD